MEELVLRYEPSKSFLHRDWVAYEGCITEAVFVYMANHALEPPSLTKVPFPQRLILKVCGRCTLKLAPLRACSAFRRRPPTIDWELDLPQHVGIGYATP